MVNQHRRRVTILFSEEEYAILKELRAKTRLPSDSDAIRVSVVIVDVLLKAGVFNLLKPLPDLIEMVKEDSDKSND
ncbi:MAG: hypothetical protein QXO47_10645 [Thermoproteota archaeon]